MDLDDAYANSAYIPDGDSYYARWSAAAKAFRTAHPNADLDVAYGDRSRQTYDIFRPKDAPKGTVIFVHGGYWMACTPKDFSHLAAGAVGAGFNCAMPCYTLAPDARISEITREIKAAVGAIAAATQGPLYLTGHSAGGHLVARMVCDDVRAPWQSRVAQVMPISLLADLAPLMQTRMNETLRLNAVEAEAESLIFHTPRDIPVTVWVGAAERPAFLDQAQTLVQAWGAEHEIDPGRHHFDVIDGLLDPHSAMMRTLLGKAI